MLHFAPYLILYTNGLQSVVGRALQPAKLFLFSYYKSGGKKTVLNFLMFYVTSLSGRIVT